MYNLDKNYDDQYFMTITGIYMKEHIFQLHTDFNNSIIFFKNIKNTIL